MIQYGIPICFKQIQILEFSVPFKRKLIQYFNRIIFLNKISNTSLVAPGAIAHLLLLYMLRLSWLKFSSSLAAKQIHQDEVTIRSFML